MPLNSYWMRFAASLEPDPVETPKTIFTASGNELNAIAIEFKLGARKRLDDGTWQHDDFYRYTLIVELRKTVRHIHQNKQYYRVTLVERIAKLTGVASEPIERWLARIDDELTAWLRTFESWRGIT